MVRLEYKFLCNFPNKDKEHSGLVGIETTTCKRLVSQ